MGRAALIIEDEAVLARNMQRFFERHGYAARTAESAEDGLRLIGASRPDIVLLDYQLPGMNGLELLARLKDSGADLKVVMLTGQGSVEVAVEAMRLGATDFLPKPVVLDKLRGVVDRILGGDTPAAAESEAPGEGIDSGAVSGSRSRLYREFRRDVRRLLDD